jgi:hypothetical protein
MENLGEPRPLVTDDELAALMKIMVPLVARVVRSVVYGLAGFMLATLQPTLTLSAVTTGLLICLLALPTRSLIISEIILGVLTIFLFVPYIRPLF